MNKTSRLTSQSVKLAALALALAVCGAGSAMAATASATSTSTVVDPIKITKAADLAFGTFASASTPGTVTITPGGARSFTGGVVGVGGGAGAAKFDVTGSGTMTYSVTLTSDATLSDGTNSMAFTRIADTSASAITSGDVTSGALTAGKQSIYVGGTLAVGANQVAGTYTGTITAVVDYN
jgi:spore coat protein U-like protein